jgi:predicted site-specific integrase-resolvase
MTMPKLATKPNPEAPDTLLTPKELCARWRCHLATLQRWVIADKLHPMMIGGKFRRYRLKEIERIEREGTK